MRAGYSGAGFKAAVGDALEAHAGSVVGGGLFRVADVPVDMVVGFVGGERGGGACWVWIWEG